MKSSTALTGGVVLLLFAASILLMIVTGEQKSKVPSDNVVFDSSENILNVLRNKTNPETPQIMEVPQTYSATQGELLVGKNGKKLTLPLLHTNVNGNIEGFTARVTVNQIYINSFDSTIEALYTFPLPENAAVDSMILEIGDKRIKGVIKERQEARTIYEEARRQGKATTLLEQQRPNIFTQSLANILPGDTIVITISYLQTLTYKNGKYLFNFPMVVGPRYIPGKMLREETTGRENPTEQVPDAHTITPPILPPGTRSGHDISLQVVIHSILPVRKLTSPSHRISVSDKDSIKIVQISPNDQIPNKDFMLEYTVAGEEINTVFLTHKEKNSDGYFQLIMVPKIDINEQEIFPRELVFVVDNSGSMMGDPIEKCKELMRLSLGRMRGNDLFRVIKFSGSTEILSSSPLIATESNVRKAMDFVDQMYGSGGTEMMNAINAIFDAPRADGRKRLVLFMTDGYVGNEREIISTIRNRLGDSRVFSLGVGSSVNRYLLEGMGYAGRGDCMIIRQDGEAQKTINEFYAKIDAPVLTDLSLSWDGVYISDQQPGLLPDLFQNQPLSVTGKYSHGGKGTLIISGKLSGGKIYRKQISVILPDINNANSTLPPLWARKKIEVIDLSGSNLFTDKETTPDFVKSTILKLGLEYKIMTQYTSFVAVDDAVRNKSGAWTPVEQPVELPEGVSSQSQPEYRFASGGGGRGSQTRAVSAADIYGKGGFAKDIDEILSGVGGLKSGGSGGVGRKGVAGIGYGSGYGSGFGGAGTGGTDTFITSGPRAKISFSAPEFMKGAALTGSRSKASVMRVVMQNLAALRYAYNKRLRDKTGLSGKITIKFAIDEFGNVIFCTVVESTMNDSILEKEIVSKINRWRFEAIDKPGDVTEVVYPFVFSL